jgi:DNA-binding NarL/FixJ family response regulator
MKTSNPTAMAVTPSAVTATDSAPAPAVRLPLRERMVVALYCEGHTAGDIALVLTISTATVRTSVRRVRTKYERLGLRAATKLQLRECLVADGVLRE